MHINNILIIPFFCIVVIDELRNFMHISYRFYLLTNLTANAAYFRGGCFQEALNVINTCFQPKL